MLKRDILSEINQYLNTDNKAVILLGPRQVGKTTIMKIIALKYDYSCFLDLDVISNKSIFEHDQSVLFYLELKGFKKDSNKIFYFFVDEFQNLKNSTLIFKNLIDHFKNIKIIASGSSSLKIKSLVTESLVGRAYIFNIYPLSFKEFLEFKNENELANILKKDNIPNNFSEKLNIYLREFLIFGGYPEVVLTNGVDNKYKILENIFQFYLQKDIRDLLNVKNIANYEKLMRYIALICGNLLKVNNVGQEIGIDNITINHYLSLLEDTFLIYRLKPYFSNKINSIKKIPKIYLIDNGFRNYLIKNFQEIDLRIDKGQLIESYVFSEIIKNKNIMSNLFFWLDKNHNEIDFIYECNGNIDLIEVKSSRTQSVNKNAFKIFNTKIGAKQNLVLSFDKQGKESDLRYDLLSNFAYKYLK